MAEGSRVLSTQPWEAGLPLAMATEGRETPPVWPRPSRPHRLPRRLQAAKWA